MWISKQVLTYYKKNMRDDVLGFAASSPNTFAVRQKSTTVGVGSDTWDKTLLLCFSRLRQDPKLPTGSDISKRKLF